MKKRIQLILGLTGSLFIASLVLFTAPRPVSALINSTDAKNEACQGISLSNSTSECNAQTSKTADNLLSTVINIFSLVAGIIAVIMVIIGGLKYITSQGESANVTTAKNTILYAIVGLVIVALAQVIVRFVLSKTK